MKTIFTGLRASAEQLHIGNYLGALKPFLDLTKGEKAFLMLADVHSLTTVHNGKILTKNRKEVLLNYFSLIPEETLQNPNFILFEQSKLVNHLNTFWALASVTPYSLMLRSHSFKDSQNKNSEINMATFNYAILMTTDIVNFDSDLVPVGADQKQHIEFARDIAENFNKTYEVDFYKLPQDYISEDIGTIPGLDGRKMSKSYDNFIGLFEDPKTLKKKIMSIPTDDTPLEAPKNPETCNVFSLIKLVGKTERTGEIRQKYLKGNYGYGHAKLELLEIFTEYLKPFVDRKKLLENDFSEAQRILDKSNKIANEIVDEKWNKMRKIIGF